MINLQDFVNRWQGKHIDYDGSFGAQCTDIVKQWEHENKWPVVRGNAIDVPRNAPSGNYTWVKNGLRNKPDPGDIVIFNMAYPYGHIGICTSADLVTLRVFEQNNPLGGSCRIGTYPLYRNVIGWLSHKSNVKEQMFSDKEWLDIIWRILHHTWRITHNMARPNDDSIKADRDYALERYKSNNWIFSDLLDRWKQGK